MKPTVNITMNCMVCTDDHERYQLKHIDRDDCEIEIVMVINDNTSIRLKPDTAYKQIFNAILNEV